MSLKPENIEFRNKVMEGVKRAYEKLVISSAEKNEKLVIADNDGNVQLVDAKELLKKFSKAEKV
jgi:hypothetical protein